jgi:Caspase domain
MPNNLKDYAIVVGIDKYSQLQRLTSAIKDAIAFTEWLLADNGGKLTADQIHGLIEDMPGDNVAEARPNQIDIMLKMRKLGILKGQKLGRRLYFYFSGHGFAREFVSDDVGMLLANASMTALSNNIGLRPYRELFRSVPYFEEVVFILDCCREVTPRNVDLQKPADDIGALKDLFVEANGELKEEKFADLVILGASHAGKSLALDSTGGDDKRGLLTKAVLEALNGEPKAANQTGQITAKSLGEYVKTRVEEKSNGEQIPEVLDSKSDGIIFRTIVVPPIKVHIKVDESVKSDLILIAGEQIRFTREDIENDKCRITLERSEEKKYVLISADPFITKEFKLDKVEGEEYEVSFP